VDEELCGECLTVQIPGIPFTEITNTLLSNKPTGRRCPICGTDPAEAVAMGLVGCPLCYEVFADGVWKQFGITRGNWSKSPVRLV
jgi:protein-arginine kinase activator protein McsA